MPPILRPYQVEAVASARVAIKSGARSVLLVSPTGSGKTVLAADIIRSAVAKGSRTLFLAHRRELIRQTSDKLSSFSVPHGIIMAGEPMALQQSCQVASIQTLARRRDVLSAVDLIFFDEAHHAAATTYQEVLKWFPSAKVVGLTATPWRQDGRGLNDIFVSHVIVSTPAQLRDQGFLVPVGGWAYESIDTSEAQVRGGDFVASTMADAAKSKRVIGDVVAEYVRYGEDKRGIVFAVSVEASQLMAAAFVEAGVAAEHLDGETPREERDAILARLRSGKTRVVCNCNVLTEGFDCPELEVCMLARPTLSPGLYLQMVGRVLRPAQGKDRARIHDHANLLVTHGHPYAERDYLPCEEESVNASRKDAEAREPKELHCPSCHSVRSRWPCDSCGYSPTPQELQYEDAKRRAIEADGLAKAQAPDAKRAAMAAKFRTTDWEQRREFYMRMVTKHGPRKAVGVYRWWSGETSWPKREWKDEAGFYSEVRS
jgi:superfamily II DNA or RNA helicase